MHKTDADRAVSTGPKFPLERFAAGAELPGEKSLDLAEHEIVRIRGAIGVLERVLPHSDPRRPILRSTEIRFVEDQGHEKAAGRWDAQGGFVEIGRPALTIDSLQLIVVLGHELTHAVNEKTLPADLNELLQCEVRAYESELPVVRRVRRLLGELDGLEDGARRYFELTLDRHEVAATTMLQSYKLKLELVSFANMVGRIYDQMQATNVVPRYVEFLEGCMEGMAEVCLAPRPMSLADRQTADRILMEFGNFMTNTPNLRLNDGGAIDRVIAQLRQQVNEVTRGFQLLAKKEALVADQARTLSAAQAE